MLLQGEEDQCLTTPCWQQQRNMSDLYASWLMILKNIFHSDDTPPPPFSSS